jgi:hypothetical protein
MYVLWRLFRIKVTGTRIGVQLPKGMGSAAVGVVVLTVALALAVGFIVGPIVGRGLGYTITFLMTLPAWWILKQMGFNVALDSHVVRALVAVIITSYISAMMGAWAWAGVGEMGRSAWVIVFPGWGTGDTVAGSLAIPIIWVFYAAMAKMGLVWRPLR